MPVQVDDDAKQPAITPLASKIKIPISSLLNEEPTFPVEVARNSVSVGERYS